MPICLKWLTDQVYAIRQNACKILKRLYDIFKGEDFEKKLIAKLNAMIKVENYLIRITVVLLIKEFLSDEYELDFMNMNLTSWKKNYFRFWLNYPMIKYLM